MNHTDFPWPEAGDRLFGEDDSESRHSACIGSSRDEWYGYSEGYRRATELLLEHVLATRRDLDTLVYPIVFSARHYVELKLKYLVRAAAGLIEVPADFEKVHLLSDAWRVLRPLLEKIFSGHGTGELEIVERVLTEFDSRDPSSMAFRYPEDRRGNPSQASPSRVGLRTFQTTFQRVASFLESCDNAIEEYAGYKCEMPQDLV